MNHWHLLKFAVQSYLFRSCWEQSLNLAGLSHHDIAFYFVTKVNFEVQNRDIGPADKVDNFERQIVSKTLDDRTYLTGTATANSRLWNFYNGNFWISKKTCCALKSNCNKTVSHLSATKSTQKKPQRHFQYEQKLSCELSCEEGRMTNQY